MSQQVIPAQWKDQIKDFGQTLTWFENPHKGVTIGTEVEVSHICKEFTHLCPFTGHPDYATLTISFLPEERIVELKSLKLYLQQYRNIRISYEVLVAVIKNDLRRLLGVDVIVSGVWQGRGGIHSEVTA